MNNLTEHKNQVIELVKSEEHVGVLDLWQEFEWARSEDPNPLSIEVENIHSIVDGMYVFLYLSEEFHQIFHQLEDSDVYSLISNQQIIFTHTSIKDFSDWKTEKRALDNPLGGIGLGVESDPMAIDLNGISIAGYLDIRDDRDVEFFTYAHSEGFHKVILISPIEISSKITEQMLKNRGDLV